MITLDGRCIHFLTRRQLSLLLLGTQHGAMHARAGHKQDEGWKSCATFILTDLDSSDRSELGVESLVVDTPNLRWICEPQT